MKLTINQLRKQIDKLDKEMIAKLAKRKSLSLQIGNIKAEKGENIVDKKREKKLMIHYKKLAEKYDLQPTFIKKLFKWIIENSKDLQISSLEKTDKARRRSSLRGVFVTTKQSRKN